MQVLPNGDVADKERAVRRGKVQGLGWRTAQVGTNTCSKNAPYLSSRRTEWHWAKPDDFAGKLPASAPQSSGAGELPAPWRLG